MHFFLSDFIIWLCYLHSYANILNLVSIFFLHILISKIYVEWVLGHACMRIVLLRTLKIKNPSWTQPLRTNLKNLHTNGNPCALMTQPKITKARKRTCAHKLILTRQISYKNLAGEFHDYILFLRMARCPLLHKTRPSVFKALLTPFRPFELLPLNPQGLYIPLLPSKTTTCYFPPKIHPLTLKS